MSERQSTRGRRKRKRGKAKQPNQNPNQRRKDNKDGTSSKHSHGNRKPNVTASGPSSPSASPETNRFDNDRRGSGDERKKQRRKTRRNQSDHAKSDSHSGKSEDE